VVVLAVKEDLLGYDVVSLCIEVAGGERLIIVQPETSGYRRVIDSIHLHRPGIEPDWYQK
jgi:hypothetical protein